MGLSLGRVSRCEETVSATVAGAGWPWMMFCDLGQQSGARRGRCSSWLGERMLRSVRQSLTGNFLTLYTAIPTTVASTAGSILDDPHRGVWYRVSMFLSLAHHLSPFFEICGIDTHSLTRGYYLNRTRFRNTYLVSIAASIDA